MWFQVNYHIKDTVLTAMEKVYHDNPLIIAMIGGDYYSIHTEEIKDLCQFDEGIIKSINKVTIKLPEVKK